MDLVKDPPLKNNVVDLVKDPSLKISALDLVKIPIHYAIPTSVPFSQSPTIEPCRRPAAVRICRHHRQDLPAPNFTNQKQSERPRIGQRRDLSFHNR